MRLERAPAPLWADAACINIVRKQQKGSSNLRTIFGHPTAESEGGLELRLNREVRRVFEGAYGGYGMTPAVQHLRAQTVHII